MFKLLFRFILIVIILALVVVALDQIGKLPQGIYSRLFGFTAPLISSQAGPYDGNWQAKLTPNPKETEQAICGSGEGRFIIRNNRVLGSIANEFDSTFMLSARVESTGTLVAEPFLQQTNKLAFSGSLTSTGGSINWEDTTGCEGSAEFTRNSASYSDNLRYVETLEGSVEALRTSEEGNEETIPLSPGVTLYPGDVIVLPDDSHIVLSLGYGELVLNSATRYEIADLQVDEAPLPSLSERFSEASGNLIFGL